ncbi:MAG TPA: L-rhamnose mutarotase [Verrucomicrobiales bacterium]|nr:L-rhamnose mutarotase [Verrucomicrobiales bacterium]
MIRQAFVMTVNPGAEAEYAQRHNPIWPELEAVLRAHGVGTYSIFLHPKTRQLFAYVEFSSQAQWDSVGNTEVVRRWWRDMRELMPTHADNSPVAEPLTEVFYLGGEREEKLACANESPMRPRRARSSVT